MIPPEQETKADSDLTIEGRLRAVHDRINVACLNANRQPDSVNLLAVSKTKPVSDVEQAIQAGQVHFGENYLQDALEKIEMIGHRAVWHFIGAIQSNKTRAIAENFDWVHTVSSLKVARRLNEQRPESLAPLKIFLQINIDNDAAKSGLKPPEIEALKQAFDQFERLELVGLMTLPTQREGLQGQREPFQALAELQRDQLPSTSELSMGMSGDLEAAIMEGATWVRIGTDIFGARQKND